MTKKVIILDTIYVLPLFGIVIELSPSFLTELKLMWKNGLDGYQLYLPTPCLLESLYKLNREFRQSNNPEILDRYSLILPTILTSKVLTIIDSFTSPIISKLAMKIRKTGHSDLMDCLIGATAASMQGTFITEDKELRSRLENLDDIKHISIYTWVELQQNLA
jgi:predicted nucleic acid-binding protein